MSKVLSRKHPVKSEQPSTPKVKNSSRYRMWIADFGGDGCEIGYLVTTHDPNRPIAFFPFEESLSPEWKSMMFQDAERVAGGEVSLGDLPRCVPLEAYGRPDSNWPMPGFVFRLGLREIGNGGGENTSKTVFPLPYCRFREKQTARTTTPAVTASLDEKDNPIYVGSIIYDALLGGIYGRVIHVLGDGLIFQPFPFSGPDEDPGPKPMATSCHQVVVVDGPLTSE